ncbi:hypothetical protein BS50DRAFT_601560 [Corynespora cassiicola Philippines]|uniref:Uncharacterized protein n=1 Tax=Corynespora cassiicola Philippines TaxID=1448308 RepID=A0A2T2NIF1_CORCC|nr:hypothetical protein BS50DRAFT_601560 [Corynespora cassiicola Philippines]
MRSLSLGLLLAVAASASPLLGERDFREEFDKWEEKVVKAGFALEPPPVDPNYFNFTVPEETKEFLRLNKRCDNRVIVEDRTENFVDWDVQMSPVICATGEMMLHVTQGYQVSNAITVSAGVDYAWIKDVLNVQFRIDYTRTWTTTTSINTVGTITDGNCGVMIWKPLTVRRFGRVMEGCPGNMKEVGTWMADDRGKGSYEGVDWISGARGMCIKPGRNPPLSRCQGQGDFI